VRVVPSEQTDPEDFSQSIQVSAPSKQQYYIHNLTLAHTRCQASAKEIPNG